MKIFSSLYSAGQDDTPGGGGVPKFYLPGSSSEKTELQELSVGGEVEDILLTVGSLLLSYQL